MKELREKLNKVYNKLSAFQEKHLNTKARKVTFVGANFLLVTLFFLANGLFIRFVTFPFMKNLTSEEEVVEVEVAEEDEDSDDGKRDDGDDEDDDYILITSDPEGVEVWITDDVCCNEEYTFLGNTPYKLETENQDYFNHKLKLVDPNGNYKEKEMSLSNWIYRDEISVKLDVYYVNDMYANWKGGFEINFISRIRDVEIREELDKESDSLRFYEKRSDELLACVGLDEKCEEGFHVIEVAKDNRVYYLSLETDFMKLFKEAHISLSGDYWQSLVKTLPPLILRDIPVNDGIEIKPLVDEGDYYYYLITSEGERYKVFHASLVEGLHFDSYKTGQGKFKLLFRGSTIYDLDLVNKKVSFSKYLKNDENFICENTQGMIDDQYVYCIDYDPSLKLDEDQKLVRYSYITGETVEVGYIPSSFGRGPGYEDYTNLEKSSNGTFTILADTFRNKDTLIVVNENADIVYRCGDEFITFAHFISDEEMVYVRARSCMGCWDEEESSQLVKYNLETKSKTILDEKDMYIDFDVNQNGQWGAYRKLIENEKGLIVMAQMYVINIETLSKKKISDQSIYPLWLSEDKLFYQIPGKCSVVGGSDSSFEELDHCYYPREGPPEVEIESFEDKIYVLE